MSGGASDSEEEAKKFSSVTPTSLLNYDNLK